MIVLTYFPSLRCAQGSRHRTTWTKLLARLATSRTVAVKEDTPGISLATYRGDKRAKANVEHVYAVGLDLDKRVDWDALLERFAANDSFLHTTWSSTPTEPRARVFLRLSRPVTGAEYVRVYQACARTAEAGGLEVDRKASDPSRFWFVPSTPPGVAYRWSIGEGEPVDVDWALSVVPAEVAYVPPASTPPPRGVGDVLSRAAAYVDRCEPAISGSGGSTTTIKLAQALVRGFALNHDEAFCLMWGWNVRCEPPWKEWEIRKKIRDAERGGVMPIGLLRDRPMMRRAS